MRRTSVVVFAMMSAAPAALGEPEPGWTLYGGLTSEQTHLADIDGEIVHTWESDHPPGASVYLVEGGAILRPGNDGSLPGPSAGGAGGRIQKIAWDGTVLWDYELAGADIRQHHDIRELANGNVLAVVWERMSAEEAIAMGRDPSTVVDTLWSEAVYEIRPTGPTTGEVVWTWRVWDHLVQDFDPDLPNYGDPAQHPGRIDINYATDGFVQDWLHFNAMDYNEALDQIVVSCHAFDELWVFSHDPGEYGDLLYRWGNPRAYGRGDAGDQRLFGQHDTQWIDEGLPGAGNLLVFDNGAGRPGDEEFSRVVEIEPPLNPDGTYAIEPGGAYGPSAPTWSCDEAGGETFYSGFISGAQRLPNGNTLVCSGAGGEFFELAADCSVQWEMEAGEAVFRCTRIGIRDVRVRGLLWCAPDLARPYEVLDEMDVAAFVDQFEAGEPGADLAEPIGVHDFSDVIAYVEAFAAGCP